MSRQAPERARDSTCRDTRSFPVARSSHRLIVLSSIAIFTAIYAVEVLAILLLNDGHFIYTLDDPYIHLALAKHIAQGHYGINAGEYAAPSSSILWPFLLAPFCRLGVEYFAPLAINYVASIGAIGIVNWLVDQCFDVEDVRTRRAKIGIVVAFFLAINLPGVAFTGMEHSLQVFFALAVTMGLIHVLKSNNTPWWFSSAIVLGPLVRYENLALSVPTIGYLLFRRHYKAASVAGLLLGAALLGFSLFLYALGLGWLPTSVIAKSVVVDGPYLLTIVGHCLFNIFSSRLGLQFAIYVLVLLYFAWCNSNREQRLFAMWAATVGLLHMLVGEFGWFSRYELYAWATLLASFLYLHRVYLADFVQTNSSAKVGVFLALYLLITCPNYLLILLKTPYASNNIYEQQYQMHRFVDEYYRAPVAVNDIGWVAYGNKNYVLDLWGLASREALAKKRTEGSGEWITSLANHYDVKLAMVYDLWIPNMPSNWIAIGKLYLGKPRVVVGDNVVTMYALPSLDHSSLEERVRQFRLTLPEGVKLILNSEWGSDKSTLSSN